MIENDIHEVCNLIEYTYKHENIWPDYTYNVIKIDFDISFDKEVLKYNKPYLHASHKVAIETTTNKIIGVGTWRQTYMSDSTFELCYGTVLPEYQRKGIGSALIKNRIEAIKLIRPINGIIFIMTRFLQLLERFNFINVIEKYNNDGSISNCMFLRF
jgi:GNAT superfamily N-acetyltransferase